MNSMIFGLPLMFRCKLKKCRQPYLLFFKSITPSLLVTQSSVSGISKTINFAREASVLPSIHLFIRFLLLKIDDDSEQDILDFPCILMLFAATISFLLIVSLLLAVSPVSLSGVFLSMKHFEFNSAALAVDNEDLTMVSEPTNSISLSSSEGLGMGLARDLTMDLAVDMLGSCDMVTSLASA